MAMNARGAAWGARDPASIVSRKMRLPFPAILVVLFAIGVAGCKDERTSVPPPAELRGRPIIQGGVERSSNAATGTEGAKDATAPSSEVAAPHVASSRAEPAKPPGLYPVTTFEFLAGYKYVKPSLGEEPVKPRPDQIPANVKALDHSKVTVIGYMAPLDMDDDGNVSEFMLLRNQLFCCYGKPLEMNEWVEVKTDPDHPVKQQLDMALAASGELSVGETDIDGMIVSIYRLKLEDVRAVEGKDAKAKPLPKQ